MSPAPPPAAVVRRKVRLPIRVDDLSVEASAYTFEGLCDASEHLAIELGDPSAVSVPLVRLHSECLTGDVLGSQRCDCGPQLREGVERISGAGGYLLYLRQEGRGIGLYNKIDAYALQEGGLDTYEANLALGFGKDERTYLAAAQMLLALGVTEIDLLSNNPDKAAQLVAAGVRIRCRVPTAVHRSSVNGRYLVAKASNGHDVVVDEGSAVF